MTRSAKITTKRKARTAPPRTAHVGQNETFASEPPADCQRCPRLVTYRNESADAEPTWFNGAVPSFGPSSARLLIVGLAPGLKGANKTGRPFTGDYAGDLLYQTLSDYGFSSGTYAKHKSDGLKLHDCMITNAVRCVPPQNKPTPEEIKTCRPFFKARMRSLKKLTCLLALGRIAHDQILSALDEKRSAHPFAHGATHVVNADGKDLLLYDSFHCSRYNTNTRRLTDDMFRSVFSAIRQHLDEVN